MINQNIYHSNVTKVQKMLNKLKMKIQFVLLTSKRLMQIIRIFYLVQYIAEEFLNYVMLKVLIKKVFHLLHQSFLQKEELYRKMKKKDLLQTKMKKKDLLKMRILTRDLMIVVIRLNMYFSNVIETKIVN